MNRLNIGIRCRRLLWFWWNSFRGRIVMLPGNERNMISRTVLFSLACLRKDVVFFNKRNVEKKYYFDVAGKEKFHDSFDVESRKIIVVSPIYRYSEQLQPGKIYIFPGALPQLELKDDFQNALEYARKHFRLPDGEEHLVEVFGYHHGLNNAPPELTGYIRGKTFIDAGAFIGDSALALSQYRPGKIISFELSGRNAGKFRETMTLNQVDPRMIELRCVGLGERFYEVSAGAEGPDASAGSGGEVCRIVPLDSFPEHDTGVIGFIKADLEGMAYEMVKGMLGTLRRDRPVLSLAIYHSPDEFYGIRELLEQHLTGYTYRIARFYPAEVKEIVLFAWPDEISPSKEWWW